MRTGVPGTTQQGSARSLDTSAGPTRTHLSPVRWVVVLALLVAAVVVFTHWPVLDAQAMSFDDEEAVVDNPLVQNPSWSSVGRFFREVTSSSVIRGYYRPLTLTSLMLDWAMGGRPDNLRVFHRTSLALHVGSTVLLILLCYQIFGRPVIAAMVGLLFGLHPMTVEPIAWVMERKTILAAIFAFACLNAYVRYVRVGGKHWYGVTVVLYLVSLLAKPTVTPLPLMMLLMDYWPLNRLSRRSVIEKIPFFILAAAFALLCVICEEKVNPLNIPAKLSPLHLPLRLCWLTFFYPYKILLPVRLTSVYMLPDPLTLSNRVVLLAVVLVAMIVTVVVLCRRRFPVIWVSLAIFYVGLSPTMGFVGYSWVSASDKYAYLPAVGLLLLLAWLLGLCVGTPGQARQTWRPTAVGAGVVIVAVLLAIGTRRYIAQWQTSERHEFYMYRLAPNSPFTNYGCARIYQDKGELDKSLRYYNHAIELKPDDRPSYYNRGVLFGDLKDYDRAIQDYTKVIELQPTFVQAYCNRGNVYSHLRNYDRAIADYSKAIELQPGFAQAYSNRGNVYKDRGEYDRAVDDFNRAIELHPSLAEAYNNRGLVYNKMSDYKQALLDFDKAIGLKPHFAEALYNRGNAYVGLGDYGRAIVDFGTVIKLKPDDPLAYYGRGNAYAWVGDYERAIQDCGSAIELKSDYVEAYNTRATAHINLKHYRQAIQDCTQAIALQPDHAMAYNNRAVSYYWLKEYGRAWADVKQCEQLGGKVNSGFLQALRQAASRPKS